MRFTSLYHHADENERRFRLALRLGAVVKRARLAALQRTEPALAWLRTAREGFAWGLHHGCSPAELRALRDRERAEWEVRRQRGAA